MTPLISVVMPVRDGGTYLRRAVDSILDQSLRELELIIIDDHSSDGAVDGLSALDSRIRMMRCNEGGVAASFNTALAATRGSYIARMDADDIALPGRLEQQLQYFNRHPEIEICGGCVEIISTEALKGGYLRYQRWLNACRTPADIHREMFIESPIPNPTVIFRRESLFRLGGYADPDWPEDYDLYLRADALGMKMGKPEGVVLKWREHPLRLTHTDPRYGLDQFQAAKAHFLVHHRLPGCRFIIWGAGPTGRRMHDLLISEGGTVTGFLEIHPRRIGGRKRGLPVWPLDKIADLRDGFIIVAVGAAGARKQIRSFMEEHERCEGEDYLFVA